MSNNKNSFYENNIKKYFHENNFIDKKLLIDNLNFLSNIYFIDYKYYNDNFINKITEKKIHDNKLMEILFDYQKYKEKSIKLIEKYKLFGIGNIIEDRSKEESLMHYRTVVERNITIFDFINEKK